MGNIPSSLCLALKALGRPEASVLRWLGYTFKVSTNRLANIEAESHSQVELFNHFSGDGKFDDFETVNFLFAKENQGPRLLLQSHALILSYDWINQHPDKNAYRQEFKTDKHLFTAILSDDNQDKVLDRQDQIHLLASDKDGSNLTTIAINIQHYDVIDHNQLLITQGNEGDEKTLIYDLTSGTSKMLNTELPSS